MKKFHKKSSLRQSVVFDDLSQDSSENDGSNRSVNKPTIGRSNSLMKKKKHPSSRLSFGPGEIISGDAAEALDDDETFTPRKSGLGRRVIKGNNLRNKLPIRFGGDEDEERPTYSKDYLNELKSSTPSTPKDLQALQPTAEDEESLDASELEGAMIVDDVDMSKDFEAPPAVIPSEAEIREKKDRRARLAHEEDYISLNDDDGAGRLLILPKKKVESRLVREDEDIAEGFEDFVDDGKISLGKKQEREARRRHKKEMADMIRQAEGSSGEESDNSEAERIAAYEAAQTRAGMDGLHKPGEDVEITTAQVPAKITPLPNISECLERLQNTLSSMEQELTRKHKKMEESKKEKQEIAAREVEVQELLKQAGAKYASLNADTNGAIPDAEILADASSHGFAPSLTLDRGLESFGNTPTVRPNVEDVG